MGHKYPLLAPTENVAALAKMNFRFKSQRGSHAKYTDGERTVIVPMHNEVARGTLKSILAQAGMDLEDFLALL